MIIETRHTTTFIHELHYYITAIFDSFLALRYFKQFFVL